MPSCAARVEKKLNRMDGVEATVNYATEKARVTFREDISVADLIATVEATGYTAREPEPVRPAAETRRRSRRGEEADDLRPLRQRLTTAVVLAVPVIAMAMVPALQFTYWQWLSLTFGGARGDVRRLALPQGRLDQRPARRRHHGHADLRRYGGGVPVVAVGAVLRLGRHARHDPPPSS